MLAQHYHSVVDEAAARKVLEQVGLGHRVTHLPSQRFWGRAATGVHCPGAGQ